jgi:hypothetical protein
MYLNAKVISSSLAAAAMTIALTAGAQAPADSSAAPAAAPAAPAQAPAAAPAPAAPAAPPTWSVGPLDLSGFIDGYYSFNFNRPNTTDDNDQINQLYNFNDKTDQFELSAAKLTLAHSPDPVGADVDFIYGRTNELINKSPTNSSLNQVYDDTFVSQPNQLPYIEQAFVSLKPPKAKGFEMDFGKWVTSAGAEVIESMNNWNYSRSLLFVNAIPYWHFGARTSLPVGKFETVGFQLYNGWNNVSKSNGGVSGAFTSGYVKPKFSLFANYLVGPENSNTTNGLRNLIDATLLLTPPGKVNAYINYDYGSNRDAVKAQGDTALHDWWGTAGAVHIQASAKNAISLRGEYFTDPDGFQTGTEQNLVEGTFTYEYKWVEGLLMRVEYRCDASNKNYFNKLADQHTSQQQTVTLAFVAFFGPKR